ncbi:MAG TPA: hypothetical protein VFW87_26885 [Pirellulales bacterium]|nr:hypothetical protein [Pirellulales bacterium]
MHSRWLNIAVVVFWLITMGWLVKDKILPSLYLGEPPTYRTILAGQPANDEPVVWKVYLNGERLGQAELSTRTLDSGVAELRSRLQLSRLPLAEITPAWMHALVRLASGNQDWAGLVLSVQAESRLEIDSLGHPIGIHSDAWVGESGSWPASGVTGGSAPAGVLQVSLEGTFEGQQVKLKVRSGRLVYNTLAYLPPDALLSDALSPQSRLPHLKVGQSWAMPVYSPLRPPTAPLEVLRATVVRREPIAWGDQLVDAYLVDFRADPGGELTGNQVSRAKAWVSLDGLVLKQEMTLLSARLTFERRPPRDRNSGSNRAP